MRGTIEARERAPDFQLPRHPGGSGVRFYGVAGGRPTVLVFACGHDDDALAAGAALSGALREMADVHVVTVGTPTAGTAFVDAGRDVHGAYGLDTADGPVAVVCDPNVRVTAVCVLGEGTGPDEVADRALDAAHDGPDAVVVPGAPVLFVPDAVTPDMVDRLVEVWEAADPVPGEVETMADGRRNEALDALRKRRRDHVVEDRSLLRAVTSHVGRRVIPEVTKAYMFTADRFEGFKIGAYDEDDAGFFAAHRDTLSPSTAHRRFAMSVNLSDDFDGGELRFPEYGPQRYRPGVGEALVFSGNLLHEVLPVTRGRRLVLLSFLFRGSVS